MSNKKQEFIEKQRKEYTIKVTTILKVLLVLGLMAGTYALGWYNRSDFANEVRSEVKSQMVTVDLKANQ